MISIIMPVYNRESLIKQSLDRIAEQITDDFELICIDDGSKDTSGAILDAYAEKYPFMTVIHQENQGCSAARNHGLQAAKGEYIWFVDDDDLVEKDCMPNIPQLLEDHPDVLALGIRLNFVEEKYTFERTLPSKNYKNAMDGIRDFFSNDSFNYYWNKIFRKDLIVEAEVGNDYAADFTQNCYIFANAKYVKNSSMIVYNYMKRSNETMVSRYVKDSEASLNSKKMALQYMLNAFNLRDDRIYDDYMIREYEVFVINLVHKDCPYTENQKISLIDRVVYNKESYRSVSRAFPANRYSEIFRESVLNGDAYSLLKKYERLNTLKNTFGGVYRQFRKFVYKRG